MLFYDVYNIILSVEFIEKCFELKLDCLFGNIVIGYI